MCTGPLRLRIVGVLVAAACTSVLLAAESLASRRDAEQLKKKVATITRFGAQPSRQGLRTTVTEGEVNSYLTYDAHGDLPAGVIDPSVSILGTGRVSARAVVDLDAVRKEKNPTSLLDPTSYLTGRLPLSATGV